MVFFCDIKNYYFIIHRQVIIYKRFSCDSKKISSDIYLMVNLLVDTWCKENVIPMIS